MSSTTRRIAASLVLPAVLITAACGSSDTPSGSTTTTAATTQTTTSASTPVETSATGAYTDKAAFIAALKAAAGTATTAHVEMTMTASGQDVTMVGDTKIDKDNPAMQMSMDMGSAMKLEMILVDKKVYMKGMPGLDPKKWTVLDTSGQLGKQLGDSLGQADPTRMYDDFEKGLTKVTFVADETVDGEALHKYELTLDPKSLEDSIPTEAAGQIPDEITYLVWLDDEDHMRKVTFELMGTKAEMLMSKYGEPVDITAPAAKDVVKAPAGM